ncbi:GNAT family N-acetyltransferase [Nocardia asteroides]|uniref:GNAT family N-acetyltransferase n=1 Tax=Nocardia asteroides TaxID=1824 RepID=UPI001E61EE84|nr:GNAT family N-acetyltransferase [Nocardia asteroides]UGT60167.1 N-acetyltransferase [Nocardia asteroides]
MNTELKHNAEDTRFEIYVDEVLAGYADYAERGTVRDFNHTVTFPEFRRRGVAAEVVEYALRDSREHGFTVLPTCWYVEQFIAAHNEYRDLVAS